MTKSIYKCTRAKCYNNNNNNNNNTEYSIHVESVKNADKITVYKHTVTLVDDNMSACVHITCT